jgi:outer membrane protein assembly factor BamB
MAGPTAKPAWTGTLNEQSNGLASSGNVLVSMGNNGITGYDPATGKSKWAKPVTIQNGVNGVYVDVDGGTVYACGNLVTDSGGTDGLFAIDAGSGTVAWNVPIAANSGLATSVSGILNGIVFVEGDNVSIHTTWIWAVDSKARKQLWRQEGGKGPDVVYVPASGNKIFIGTELDSGADTGQIQAYDAATGTKGWSVNAKSVNFAPDSSAMFAMGSGNLIYTGDQVYGLDPATGKQNWAFAIPDYDTLGWPGISPDGNLAVFAGVFTVYALDTKTGQQKWMTADSDRSHGLKQIESDTPRIADGNVYIMDGTNTVWALDVATGATRWKYTFPVAVQWAAGGGYLFATYATTLIAIKAAGQ